MTQSTSLFQGTRGNRDAKILIVGEAYGETERQENQPFVGASGQLLTEMLLEAGISPQKCLFTNCINAKPFGNDMRNFLWQNDSPSPWIKDTKPGERLMLGLHNLDTLIETIEPKLIITCGNWPTWWLTDKLETKTDKGYRIPFGIDTWRGSQLFTSESDFGRRAGIPVLPIWHPASVLRMYSNKVVCVQDLRRAEKFISGSMQTWADPTYRNFNLFPTADEIVEWIEDVRKAPENPIINDLETYKGLIHICGLADNRHSGIVIPFFDITSEGLKPTYSEEDFAKIYIALYNLFSDQRMRFVGQNYQYDMQYIWYFFGVIPQVHWDTMIAQHVMFPNLRKGLEFLAAMYCDHYVYWKDDRKESLDNEDLKAGCAYNAEDLWRTWEIWFEQTTALRALGKEERFAKRMKFQRAIVIMSNRGFRIDDDLRQRQKMALMQYADHLISWLNSVIPNYIIPESKTPTPWYKSPKQKAIVLYDQLGFKEQRNMQGGRTTDKEALAKLAGKYPEYTAIFSALIVLNSISTIAGNFLSAKLDEDGRMRCTFNVAGPITNRLSSAESSFGSGTNLQNIMRPRGPLDMLDQDLV